VVTRLRLSKAAAPTAVIAPSTDAPDDAASGGGVAQPSVADRPAGQPSLPATTTTAEHPSPATPALPAGSAPGGTSEADGPSAELVVPSRVESLPIHPSQTRPFQARPMTPSASPNADRWLRRGMAAVGVVIVVGAAIGSALSGDEEKKPAATATTGGPTVAAPPVAVPGDTEPTAPPPVLGDDLGDQPEPSASGLSRALAGALADPRLGSRVSAQVADVSTGKVLYDHGGNVPATPASTAKVLTAAALLSVTRPDDRIATQVVAGAKPGEVVLIGAGDATLSAAGPGRPTSFAGAPRISDLATQLKRNSPSKITKVVIDSSLYTGPGTAPGWQPGDVAAGYVASMTALMTDVGRVDPANSEERAERYPQPDLAAGRLLAARLGLPASAVVAGKAPAGATVLASVRSAPIARLVEQMLLESDNVLAEALARQVAIEEKLPVSFDGSARAVTRVIGRLGVSTTGMHLYDGSGLSGQDKVPPAVLVAVLRAVASVDRPTLHSLVPGLPVGGYDGTLDDRYLDGPAAVAAGSVRAKTGTLARVSSLAGIAEDKDGRLLVFAFLADDVDGSLLDAENALDEAAATLVRCGCR
jgi:D-alanyl-D-alanine carboxypeptidase/D-alanyl-D-alanine-endopeptidase (penicillin-binding protein 4)